MMVALALAVVLLIIIICILLVAFEKQRVQYETRILKLQEEHNQFLEEINCIIENNSFRDKDSQTALCAKRIRQ